jgi:hypothetical protein
LAECPPGWVRRLSVGTAVLCVAAVLWPVARHWDVLRYGGAMVLWEFWYSENPANSVAMSLLCALQFPSIYLLSSREPGRTSHRRALFLWLLVTLVGMAAWGMAVAGERGWIEFGPSGFLTWGWLGGAPDWRVAVMDALRFAYPVAPVLAFWRLRHLANRIGRAKMVEYSAIVGVAWATYLLIDAIAVAQPMYRAALYTFPATDVPVASTTPLWGEVLVPPAVVLIVTRGRRRWAWLWALAWVIATTLVVARSYGEPSRVLWKTVLVIGIPAVAGVVFWVWGVFLLGRMAVQFWVVSREAAALWRRDDAARVR